MMITAAELEELIARTPTGEQVAFEKREIGSTNSVTEKLNQLQLSRSDDPHYVIFVGIDKFGECLLTAFPTMGDPYRTSAASHGVARKTLPVTFQTANRTETRARVTLPTYGKRNSLFSELLVGRADCPFF